MESSAGLAAALLAVLGLLSLASSQTQHCGSAPSCQGVIFDKLHCLDTATIVTDVVSYVGGVSTITVEVNPNATQHYNKLYYKICYSYNNKSKNLLICASNKTQLTANINWTTSGSVLLATQIYTDSSYRNQSAIACAATEVIIAENSNLTLSVKLEDDGDTRRPTSSENHYHSLGDITFIPLPNATFDITPYTLYYDYNFGDGYHQKNSTAKNVTHSYSKEGNLTFSVDAIAVDANKQAYHAVYSSYIILIERVSDIAVTVGDDNTVQQGCTAPVTMSANGSLPITACWYIGNYSSSTGLVDSQQATRAQTCNWLYNSQELEFSKTFKDSGIFTLAATFNNSASAESGNFSFIVVAGLPCENIIFDILFCANGSNITTIVTDDVSYVGGVSTITVEVNPNVTQQYDKLYYKVCYGYLSLRTDGTLIACTGSKSQFMTSVQWTRPGVAVVIAQVFTDNKYNERIGCAAAGVVVAVKVNLSLSVQLIDNATSDQPVPLYPNNNHYHSLGNITFIPHSNSTRNFTSKPLYYYYDFGDGHYLNHTTAKNATHNYTEEKRLSYSVNAVVLTSNISALYDVYTDYIYLIEGVNQIAVTVGGDNSVQVGSTAPIALSASGSPPITVCWYIVVVNSSVPITNHTVTVATPIENCTNLINSSVEIAHTFNKTGKFAVVAEFRNNASSRSGIFQFSVGPGISPAVVASTSVVAVLVVIAVVVALILLVTGGYIPYRRYRNRMTETADFRFVDLSEKKPSLWHSVKMKASKFKYFFSGAQPEEKLGLVEMTSSYYS